MCTRYWPDLEDTEVYGWVQVVNLKETPNPQYILREFLVHHKEVRWRGKVGQRCVQKVIWGSHIHTVN